MQLQFRKRSALCTHAVLRQSVFQEETQDMILPDTMPDVAEVMGVWGHTVIRSKEWKNNCVEITGGISVKVLYLPDSGELQCMESWMPFQIQGQLNSEDKDGSIICDCFLQSADARNVSARKIIVRAVIAGTVVAYVPSEIVTYVPEEIPAGIYVKSEPVSSRVSVACGEKAFAIDEEITVPPDVERIISNSIRIEMIDKKIIAEKAVFRGQYVCDVLYLSSEGKLEKMEFEQQFSQYCELEREYDPDAYMLVQPVLTGLELTPDINEKWHLRAGFLLQFTVYEELNCNLVQDAFSVENKLRVETENFCLPSLETQISETVQLDHKIEMPISDVADITCLMAVPTVVKNGAVAQVEVHYWYQLLYYDREKMLHGAILKGSIIHEVACDDTTEVIAIVKQTGKPRVIGVANICTDAILEIQFVTSSDMQMISGIEIGEKYENMSDRPSLIIRKVKNEKLWDIAKQYKTEPDAIVKANMLESDPENGSVILIPIR